MRYIPYQMEQLGAGGSMFDRPSAREVLRRAIAVWDLSRPNLAVLASDGIAAEVVPLGYHRSQAIMPTAEPDVDILFSGSVSERRVNILKDLVAAGLEVQVLFGAYGLAKQSMLARARIHLHVHAGESALFQQPRIAHLLNNACFVITETARDNPYPKVDLVQVRPSEIVDACRYYLAHPLERAVRAERNRNEFAEHYPMVKLLQAAVASVARCL